MTDRGCAAASCSTEYQTLRSQTGDQSARAAGASVATIGPPDAYEDPVSKARIRAVPSPTHGIGLLEFSLSKSPPSPRAELGFVINFLERASNGVLAASHIQHSRRCCRRSANTDYCGFVHRVLPTARVLRCGRSWQRSDRLCLGPPAEEEPFWHDAQFSERRFSPAGGSGGATHRFAAQTSHAPLRGTERCRQEWNRPGGPEPEGH